MSKTWISVYLMECGLSPAYLEAIGFLLNELQKRESNLDEVASQTWEIAAQPNRDTIYTTNQGWANFLSWAIEKFENLERHDLTKVFRQGLPNYRKGDATGIRENEEQILHEYLIYKDTGKYPK